MARRIRETLGLVEGVEAGDPLDRYLQRTTQDNMLFGPATIPG
jgi:hypothetical protein